MAERDFPLYPGDALAVRHREGWMAHPLAPLGELPESTVDGPVCGRWAPLGWPPLVCTDHGDGYHAAAMRSPYGPRIVAVWIDDDPEGSHG
jgi:hypothetical protein